jgi:hypothetical protein
MALTQFRTFFCFLFVCKRCTPSYFLCFALRVLLVIATCALIYCLLLGSLKFLYFHAFGYFILLGL